LRRRREKDCPPNSVYDFGGIWTLSNSRNSSWQYLIPACTCPHLGHMPVCDPCQCIWRCYMHLRMHGLIHSLSLVLRVFVSISNALLRTWPLPDQWPPPSRSPFEGVICRKWMTMTPSTCKTTRCVSFRLPQVHPSTRSTGGVRL
jgi:hypothetical protein